MPDMQTITERAIGRGGQMIVYSFDPGGTTGLVMADCEQEPYIVSSKELSLKPDDWGFIIDNPRVDLILMETMVSTGYMTKGKIQQIKAIALIELFSHLSGAKLVQVTPEKRKKLGPKETPRHVTGQHAKDAYRILIAGMRGVRCSK